MSVMRWRCANCWSVTPEADLLRSKSPFDPADEITGCPVCRQTACLHLLCEVEDCPNLQSCGTPSPAGYQMLCGYHYRKLDGA
jgi:hypothetical protein